MCLITAGATERDAAVSVGRDSSLFLRSLNDAIVWVSECEGVPTSVSDRPSLVIPHPLEQRGDAVVMTQLEAPSLCFIHGNNAIMP
jgi:hypothetical protein